MAVDRTRRTDHVDRDGEGRVGSVAAAGRGSLDPETVLRPRVGFATRLPVLGDPTFIRDIPGDALLSFREDPSHASMQVPVTTFSRPVLRAEIGLWKGELGSGDRAIVYIVHLKSMTPETLPHSVRPRSSERHAVSLHPRDSRSWFGRRGMQRARRQQPVWHQLGAQFRRR